MVTVMLMFDPDRPDPQTKEVEKALQEREITYNIAFVDGYVRPRLIVNSRELIGNEIFKHLDRLQKLVEEDRAQHTRSAEPM